jgi:hypothetical protein
MRSVNEKKAVGVGLRLMTIGNPMRNLRGEGIVTGIGKQTGSLKRGRNESNTAL